MKIKKFCLGNFMTNSYLVWNDEKEAYLFDCGGENVENIETFIKNNELILKYIVLTHGHGDHIAGLNKLKNLYPDATVYIGKEEEKFLVSQDLNLMSFINGKDFEYLGEYTTVKEGDFVGSFKVFDTPGHTIGSKCYYLEDENILISGDTLFRRSYGRYDLPTGSGDDLFKSLAKLCKSLPKKTVVYSGHSDPTTIGEELEILTAQGII